MRIRQHCTNITTACHCIAVGLLHHSASNPTPYVDLCRACAINNAVTWELCFDLAFLSEKWRSTLQPQPKMQINECSRESHWLIWNGLARARTWPSLGTSGTWPRTERSHLWKVSPCGCLVGVPGAPWYFHLLLEHRDDVWWCVLAGMTVWFSGLSSCSGSVLIHRVWTFKDLKDPSYKPIKTKQRIWNLKPYANVIPWKTDEHWLHIKWFFWVWLDHVGCIKMGEAFFYIKIHAVNHGKPSNHGNMTRTKTLKLVF